MEGLGTEEECDETNVSTGETFGLLGETDASKDSWPGKLDNSVAGGVPAGMTPLESIVKECMEEASLPKDIVAPLLKPTGAVSYCYRYFLNFVKPRFATLILLQDHQRMVTT